MLEVRDLWHRYAGARSAWAIQELTFSLAEGELVGLLGPSGCGKTTLLRLIAGFERPQRGSVHLHGNLLSSPDQCLPAERRGIGLVFQDAALFPHLTAWQNACFGLSRRHSRQRIQWLLELLGLAELVNRYPHELSGGQRQRLALARSLATSPRLLLLDEPFSSLDVGVRLRLRQELPSLLQDCGTTALMVTHDPEEALAICDRVAVIKEGRLEQIATPQRLVERPASAFVGQFVAGTNLVPAHGGDRLWHTPLGMLELHPGDPEAGLEAMADLSLAIHPRDLKLASGCEGNGVVISREYLGAEWRYRVQVDAFTFTVIQGSGTVLIPGDSCLIGLRDNAQVCGFSHGVAVKLEALPTA